MSLTPFPRSLFYEKPSRATLLLRIPSYYLQLSHRETAEGKGRARATFRNCPKKLSCPSSSSFSVSFAKSPSFSFVTTTTPPTSSSFFCVSPSVFAFHFDIDILPDGPPFRPFPCFSWYPQMNFSPFPSFSVPQAVLSHDPNSAAPKKTSGEDLVG